jgi:hypothetical protein
MQEFIGIVRELVKQPGAVSVAFQRIDNFHKLVLDQLPYGQIDPASLVQGLIEFDGPAQDPPNLKKPLQWHFGGIPYEVCKAIRIQYSYQKYVEGAQLDANGSLFIGYSFADPYRDALSPEVREKLQAQANRRDAVPVKTEDLLESLLTEFVNSPGKVTPLAKYVDVNNFDAFLFDNFPFQTSAQAGGHAISSADLGVKPTPLSSRFAKGNGLPGVRIEYDGPARDYDSHRPFPYTTYTLFNDVSGIYDTLLWWYFGGKAFHITKAMKLGYTDPQGNQGSLLVGYQGPGPG